MSKRREHFKSFCNPGYWMIPSTGKHLSHFGGQVSIQCPNCKPGLMLQWACLHTSELPRNCEKPAGVERIRFLVCPRCNYQFNFFSYKLVNGGKDIEFIQFKPYGNGSEPAISSVKQARFTPLMFKKLTGLEQDLLDFVCIENKSQTEGVAEFLLLPQIRKLGLYYARNQFGGRPLLCQGAAKLRCPACNTRMPFCATFVFAEPVISRRCEGHNEGAQCSFYICAKCAILTGIGECD